MSADEHYEPIPRDATRRPLPLAGLQSAPDFPALCGMLQAKATAKTDCYEWHAGWRILYQSVVLPHPEVWKAATLARISTAASEDALDGELELLSGSSQAIALSQPDIAKAFLLRAEELGGSVAGNRMRWELYHASAPETRSWTAGQPDPEHDYVQSAALGAAKQHEADPILGPFYRWIVQREETERKGLSEVHRSTLLDMEEDSRE